MLRHIVMIKFNQGIALDEAKQELKEMLLNLPQTIDTLKSMQVGLNIGTKIAAYHLVLTADFEDEAGLDAYRIHPDHVKVLKRLESIVEKTAAVDYLLDGNE